MAAIISPCGNDCHLLTRELGEAPFVATFIMHNPSKADATMDDQKMQGIRIPLGVRPRSAL
jgi:hypothetical protein